MFSTKLLLSKKNYHVLLVSLDQSNKSSYVELVLTQFNLKFKLSKMLNKEVSKLIWPCVCVSIERPASSDLRWSTELVTPYNGCPDHLERKLYCGEQYCKIFWGRIHWPRTLRFGHPFPSAFLDALGGAIWLSQVITWKPGRYRKYCNGRTYILT